MGFRQFKNEREEQQALAIIAGIDQGEGWIFRGADGSAEFGGFIDRLYYAQGETCGTYCACRYSGSPRLQVGFTTDLPEELKPELLRLFQKAAAQSDQRLSLWYPPANQRLEDWIFQKLPWKATGHQTYELTFDPTRRFDQLVIPAGIRILPYRETYLAEVCSLLDRSLAHTFADPGQSVFMESQSAYAEYWLSKAAADECCLLLEHGSLAGFYVLKGAEIDLMAIRSDRQNRGLGRILLHHAREHIKASSQIFPYLYCISQNQRALRFYLREGMLITGHSGFASLKIS